MSERDVEHYVAIFRGESPETIRDAIEAVMLVSWIDADHMAKGQRIIDGLRALLPPEPQGSLF